MQEIILKVENVKKEYKLGQIGGTTLRDELQRLWAKLRKKEDPTRKIGTKNYNQGERFLALDGVSFEVKKGERVGIIGHNGAGKSTLLKLISRITAPTEGSISLNGRVASMLEVGTGFHPELTGRENIYMNGAILGMTKKEIDSKIEDIIEFSEVRQFIDTPVKRYSSGMYVKLAFSVAAHLDSEIMIMDEVLAVGDIAFQQKCLTKMSDISNELGRTILYVSHNMNTIRQLCNRVIVLDRGKIVFNGDVEEGIAVYMGARTKADSVIDLGSLKREKHFANLPTKMSKLTLVNKKGIYNIDTKLCGTLEVKSERSFKDAMLVVHVLSQDICVTSMRSSPVINLNEGDNSFDFEVDLARLAPNFYTIKLVLSLQNESGQIEYLDVILDAYSFTISQPIGYFHNRKWNTKYNGFFFGPDVKIIQ